MAEGKISYNAEQVEAKLNHLKDFNSWYLSREEKIDRRVGILIERLEYRLKNSVYLTRDSREVDEIALSVLKRIKEAEYKPIKWAHETLDTVYNTRMTQKAQGLMYAKGSNLGRPYHAFVFPWDVGDIDPRGNIHDSFGYGRKLFARPAPTRPRHGFVESRHVKNWDDFLKVLKETYAEDPFGEVILMPMFEAEYSFIATNAGITMGRGNDGVTAGTDKNTLFIPSPVAVNHWNFGAVGSQYGFSAEMIRKELGIEDTVYIEAVTDKDGLDEPSRIFDRTRVVQFRDGPAQEASTDFIPRTEEVKKWLQTNYSDLLAWERYIKKEIRENGGKPDGLAISATWPLSSHFAVHAIQAGISVIAKRNGPLPSKLEKVADLKPKMKKRHARAIADKLSKYIKGYKLPKITDSRGKTVVASIHAMSLWGFEEPFIDLRARAVHQFLYMQLATIMGELRYWRGEGPGCRSCIERIPFYRKEPERFHQVSRDTVYEEAIEILFSDFEENLIEANRYFMLSGWPGNFGGPAWGRVTRQTLRVYKLTKKFLENPTEARWRNVVMALNMALHTSHNNGTAMAKIIGSEWMDAIARAPQLGFMNKHAAAYLLDGKEI